MMKKAIQSRFSLFIIRFSLLTFLTFILPHFTSAKQTNLDSLWNIWQDKSQPDTVRLNALYNYAWDGFLFSKPDSAFYFAQLDYDFAKDNGLKKQMTSALDIQAESFNVSQNYQKALEYHERSLKIKKEIGYKDGIAYTLSKIGTIYQNQGENSKAIDYFNRCLKLVEKTRDQKNVAGSLINIGLSYQYQGNYPKALEYYQRGVLICEKIGEQEFLANGLSDIGMIYNNQGNYPKALEYYQRALVTFEKLGNKQAIAKSHLNIGTIYYEQGDSSRALDYFEHSLAEFEEIDLKMGIGISLGNIGAIYSDQGNYPKALEYTQKSQVIFEELGDKMSICFTLVNSGLINKLQGDYLKAIDHCQRGLSIAKSIKVLEEQKNACNCLYRTYKAAKNWKKAFEYFELQNELNDSMKADETGKQLQKFEFERKILSDSLDREKEKREIEIAYQKEIRKKDETRNIAIGSGIFVLLLALGLWSRLSYTNKTKKVIEAERDRSENLLLNILPSEIAEELKEKGAADARDFEEVTILFTDFKEFTETSEKMGPAELVSEINECFKAFDGICEKYNVEKIKTIGDAYMAAGGLPVPDEQAVTNTVKAGLEMAAFVVERKKIREAEGKIPFEMRTGIHTGPVVAGIVGVKKSSTMYGATQ